MILLSIIIKYLSSVNLEQFYTENNLNLIEAPDFNYLGDAGNMNLFATGYFSLTGRDIKNLQAPSGLNKNNKNSILLEKYSNIDCNLLPISGIFLTFGGTWSLICSSKSIFYSIFCYSLYIIMLIVLNVFSIMEIIIEKKIFKLTGYFPNFLFNETTIFF